ncbi:GGDEF domain-containing protein [Colwellia hornerae]|uniref:GGDEF domain-containing protein n=1 Tax=Colwellia hornerae TaxID=89402 RepID=UPI00147807A3|nr:GGDEF domain-containing protein [Colwellia hornerae]
MIICKRAVYQFLIFSAVYFFAVTHSALANDLNATLNSIEPSYRYDCSVDKGVSDKVERYLVDFTDLSNQERSKLLWQKAMESYCSGGFSEDYIQQLEEIILLPSNEINKTVFLIAIYDLTSFYSRYSLKKSCDFLHAKRLLAKDPPQAFLKYLDLAELQYCSALSAVEKIREFVRLKEVSKADDYFIDHIYGNIAEIYSSLGQFSLAANTYKKQLPYIKDDFDRNWSYYSIATELLDAGKIAESKHYLTKFESGGDLFKSTDDFKTLLIILKIKFAYQNKNFELMGELIDEFEPYQRVTEELYQDNKMVLYKAIACLENNRTECVNTFIAQKDLLIKQTKKSNLHYLYEFLIKHYLSQNQSSKKYFESYININQQALINQQNSVSILGVAELQQDIVALELGLVSTRLEKSRITLILSCILILVLITVCVFIWQQKNKQKILSETDELTRIYNRRAIFEQIMNLKKPLNNTIHAIIMFDLDDFKSVNDKYSHLCGDRALRHIVKLTKDNIRQQDLFGRLCGEEFVLCLKDLEKKSAQSIVENIRSSFENTPILINDEIVLTVTASFSITYIDKSISSFDSVYQRLDDALYQAKDLGRNRVVEA